MLKKTILLTIVAAMALQLSGQFNSEASTLKKHVNILASDSLLGRGFGTPQGYLAAQYIASQFKAAGIDPLNGAYLHPFNHRERILNIPGNNVVGIIPGNNPELKDEYIVLGAHFDHLGWKISDEDTVVYNGADDNASGTAAIIEIGRMLSAQQGSLGRSIVFVAFDGEESGLIGSTHFVENSTVPPHKIKLMFSLDMVGMYKARGGLDLGGIKMLNDYEQLTTTLAGVYGITVKKVNNSVEQRTDTAPFGNIGIPAVHVYTGLESPYHQPGDEATYLDYEGMASVTNYISAVTSQLASAEIISDLPSPGEDQVTGSTTKTFRTGTRVNVGTSHFNYRNEPILGKSIIATQFGFFANIQASRHLMVQPELLYETKGSQTFDGNFRTHSFTAPLNLLLATSDDQFARAYFQFGGYYSYHFGGRIGSDEIDFENIYNRHEFGITYGFGMEVMNFQIGLYFQNGLSNLLQESNQSDLHITHKNIYFMMGFMF